MRAAACLFAGMALLACAPTKDARDPSYAGWGHLERLAVAEPVLCSGSSLESYVALDALKDQVAVTAGPWTAGRPSCAGLGGEAAFDPDDLSSPRMNAEGLQGLHVEGADAGSSRW